MVVGGYFVYVQVLGPSGFGVVLPWVLAVLLKSPLQKGPGWAVLQYAS